MYSRACLLLYVCACAERGGSLWNKKILGRYYINRLQFTTRYYGVNLINEYENTVDEYSKIIVFSLKSRML